MSALILFFVLIVLSIVAFVSGVYLLGGLGWALIALAVSLLSFAAFYGRGLKNNGEE